MDIQSPTAIQETAYAMAAEQNIAFDVESEYDKKPYSGYLAFRNDAQSDREGDQMPEFMSPWDANMHSSKGEILDNLETDAAVLMAAFNNLMGFIKAGIVQAAEDDNLPMDMNQLDLNVMADRGREALENQELFDRVKALQSQTELTADEQQELSQSIDTLIEREAPIPF